MMDKDHWNEFINNSTKRQWLVTVTGIVNSWIFMLLFSIRIPDLYLIFMIIHNVFFIPVYFIMGICLIVKGMSKLEEGKDKYFFPSLFVLSSLICWGLSIRIIIHI